MVAHRNCCIQHQVSAFQHLIVDRQSTIELLPGLRLDHSNHPEGCCCSDFHTDCSWEASGIAGLVCTEEVGRHLEPCRSSLYRRMVGDLPYGDDVAKSIWRRVSYVMFSDQGMSLRWTYAQRKKTRKATIRMTAKATHLPQLFHLLLQV